MRVAWQSFFFRREGQILYLNYTDSLTAKCFFFLAGEFGTVYHGILMQDKDNVQGVAVKMLRGKPNPP